VSVIALVTAIAGGIAGLSGYGLYEAEVIGVDASANLIIASVLFALVAIPIGFAGSRLAQRRRRRAVLGQTAVLLAVGILGAWFVVVIYALGR
jgi:hypothetical protein